MEGGTQYMKFGRGSIREIVDIIKTAKLPHSDTVIIGDNSSGKSLLLNKIIESQEKEKNLYFIDAVNRGFDVKKVYDTDVRPKYQNTIVETRISREYFNLKDSFNCYGTLTERVEEIYYPYKDEVQGLFKELTGDSFDIIIGDALGEVQFEGAKGLLSSGYQAITRILLELIYYKVQCLEQNKMDKGTVIIDEIDQFLSPGYAFKIMPFLKMHFSKFDFIVTTHSSDLISGTHDANLIVLDSDKYEVLDINDYESVSEVQLVFGRVFGEHISKLNDIEVDLRRLFNNKINNAWSKSDQLQLENIKKEKLTASQLVIYKQIEEW